MLKKVPKEALAELTEKEKMRIYQQVHRAERSGLIPVATRCQACGSDGPLKKHHKDYANPLDVIYLCQKCHTAIHSIILSDNPQTVNSFTRVMIDVEKVQKIMFDGNHFPVEMALRAKRHTGSITGLLSKAEKKIPVTAKGIATLAKSLGVKASDIILIPPKSA